jgi:LysM domain
VAEFEFGYRGISGSYPAPSVGAYSVRQGDTLQSIAQGAYGDSRQWWRIAQANGLQGEQDLKVGQTLTLPSIAAGESNNASTFKPYNPSEVVGDLSPNLPQPKANDCGGMGMVIMIVVAVVVTIYTAGAAASLMSTVAANAAAAAGGGLAGAVAATGAVAGSAIGVAAGAVGAAVGSIASQLVGNAIGTVDDFSWEQVAQSAIAGGVGGVFQGATSLGGSGMQNTIVRAVVSNAMSQGIGIAVGLQDRFSWSSVAASTVGSAIGEVVSDGLLGAPTLNGARPMNTAFAK